MTLSKPPIRASLAALVAGLSWPAGASSSNGFFDATAPTCADNADHPDDQDLAPVAPDALPGDLELARTVRLDDPTLISELQIPPVAVYLIGLGGGTSVAVSPVVDGEEIDEASVGDLAGEVSGPNGLLGAYVDVDGSTFLVLWRGRTLLDDREEDLRRAIRTLRDSDLDAGLSAVRALQSPAQVPGIGSVPVSVGTPGVATGYTHRLANGDQRALGAARVTLCASKAPIDVYRFWYGSGREPHYLVSPSSSADPDLFLRYPSPAGVGDTYIYVRQDGDVRHLEAIGGWGLAELEVSTVVAHL